MSETPANGPPTSSGVDRAWLAKRADVVSALLVAAHLGFVLAPVYLAAWLGWGFFGCWIWFGLSMNGLLNLMHEASHFSVFSGRRASDLLGDWMLGPMVLADFRAYRARHWDHHRHLGSDRDTKDAYHVRIDGLRGIAFALRCVIGLEAVRKFFHQLPGGEAPSAATNSKGWLLRTALWQSIFAASLFLTAWVGTGGDAAAACLRAAIAYLFVFHFGLASLAVGMATLRAIAEHQVDGNEPARAGSAALRNFRDGPLSRLLMGAYGFSEHATHHRHPQIPSYRLPAATAALAASGAEELERGPGYFATLLRFARASGDGVR